MGGNAVMRTAGSFFSNGERARAVEMEDRCCDSVAVGPFLRCNATTPPRRRTLAHQHMNRGTVLVAPTPRPGIVADRHG